MKEIDWFYQQGASRIFPDYWRDYLAPIPSRNMTISCWHTTGCSRAKMS